jgi:hypothetical protein
MHDDYLWDRSGEPDRDVVRLEQALSAFRQRAPAPIAGAPSPPSRLARPHTRRYPAVGALIAASLVAVVGALLIGLRPHPGVWDVAVLAGRPMVGRLALDARGSLAVGQWLVTDGASRAAIDVGDIGSVEVAPNSRVRLLSTRPANNRIELQRGLVRAMIFAPPGQFAVQAPSATAVDLGCVYTLEVDEDGTGLLHVESGWVAFTHEGRESFVPAGARAQTRPGFGPGTPYFDDADVQLREALGRLDFGSSSDPDRAADLSTVLSHARSRDGITLWHLLLRVHPEERARVFDRLAQLVPPENGVTRDGILRGNRAMLDAWWDQLGMEPLSWWREWERPWQGEKK